MTKKEIFYIGHAEPLEPPSRWQRFRQFVRYAIDFGRRLRRGELLA